jgi:hypothetical protein
MKHGDSSATKSLAQLLFNKISSSKDLDLETVHKKNLVLSSSAYGSIPTAAHALMLEVSKLLTKHGVSHEIAKIERLQALSRIDYAALSDVERGTELEVRQLRINKENRLLMNDQHIILIDDLCATGGHERAIINCLLETCVVPVVNFFYVFEFSEELRNTNPMLESELNSAQVKNLDDLLTLIRDSNEPSYINARVVKFALAEGECNQVSFKRFLSLAPIEYLDRFYRAVMSSDMLFLRESYSGVVEMLCVCVHESRLRIAPACPVTS